MFPDEVTLSEMRRRLQEYSGEVPGGHQYAYLSSIDEIAQLAAEDRIGARLRTRPLAPDETAALDIEIWHSGDQEECRRQVGELGGYLEARGLRLTDSYIGRTLCLARARVNAPVLDTLLGGQAFDYIKEVDRRPEPSFEMSDLRLDLSQLDVAPESVEGGVGLVIVDSGVAQAHPLIAPALGDAQVFRDRSGKRITGGPEDRDEATGGHGTAVAGIAIYHDLNECMKQRRFQPGVTLFSARVTDEANEYDEDELIEHQLADAVEYFVENYSSVRVINISLGDSAKYYSEGSYQFRLAAVVDDLAYRYRDRNIIFVISVGNYLPEEPGGEEVYQRYPAYLLDDAEARVIDPGTSALALTVGGLSYGFARDLLLQVYDGGTERPIAGEQGWPSPFTRTGWGVDGAIKPDVVDFAGDVRFERGKVIGGVAPRYAGVPTTARDFAPGGSLFRSVAGTSFSAPRVANLAARLCREFPEASSNLIRALIADSARVPASRPDCLRGKDTESEDILRLYGYGQPDFERARWSAQNAVLLLSESVLALDSFRLYAIPELPAVFIKTRGSPYISVTLAFDPLTRHTRADSYLGVAMEFALFRNVGADEVADALRRWSVEERENLEEASLPTKQTLRGPSDTPSTVELRPGVKRRKKGTLQRGIAHLSGAKWLYEGGPLLLAVLCQRKWAPVEVTDQRYAVVVSLNHGDPGVDLYAVLRAQARAYQRARVRV